MKTAELFESARQMGKFQLPYSWPHRGHRAEERYFNFVWPELAKSVGVPPRNVKYHGWSGESGNFTIKISNQKTEVEMVELMAPKALLGLLKKAGFVNPRITQVTAGKTAPTKIGQTFPVVDVKFAVEYPQQWIDWDKQRFPGMK